MNAKQRVRIVIPVIIVIVAVTAIVRSRDDSNGAVVASGTVEAREALLGFQSPGRVDMVAVFEGDSVTVGQQLAAIDRSELDARLAAAQASVAAATAALTEMRAGSRTEDVGQARAALRGAQQRLEDASRDVVRSERLYEGGAISNEILDKHRTAEQIASAEVERIEQSLTLVEAGPRVERISAQVAVVAQAEAMVAQVDAAIANAIIAAPFSGVITLRHREPGEIVSPGAPVLTLMNPGDRWVKIYVLGDQVGRLSLGQEVSIKADGYADREYTGVISYIADQAEFTPRNVQTTEERVKLVYEVRVRITGDPSFDLKPGIAADVTLSAGAD